MVHFVAIPDDLLGEDKFYPLENLVGTFQGNLGNSIVGLVCYEGEEFVNRIQTTSQEGLPVYYSVIGGINRMPVGLRLNPETGEITSSDPLTLEHLPPDADGKGNLTRDHEWKFVVEATDGSNTERQGFSLKVKHINQAPVWITSNAAAWSMYASNAINRTVVAYDPDFEDVPNANSVISYTLPDGMPADLANTVTFNNGTISGFVPENLVANATYTFRVIATDLPPDYDPAFPNCPSAPIPVERTFTLNVFYNNYPPVWITNALADATRLIPYSVQLQATDPNPNDVLTFTLLSGSIPSGLTLSPSGLLSGTPNLTQTASFTLRVSDPRGLYADQSFTVPVAQGNNPPVWQTPSTLGEAIGGASLAYALIATDQDSDTLTYTFVGGTLPPGLTLGSDGILYGLTQEVQSTTSYTFTVNVSDGIESTDRLFTITMQPNPETPPIWDTPAGSLGGPYYGGDPFSFQLAAHDDEFDPLTFTIDPATPLPPSMGLTTSGALYGTLPATTVVSPTPTSLTPATQPTDNLVYDPFFLQGAGRWLTTGLWHPEGGPYIYVTKSDGYADDNLGSTFAITDHFAVYGNSPYTFQYTALAYNIQSGTFGVDIEWFDINNNSLGTSPSIQDGNIGNPNVNPGTQVLRALTVTSPANASWGRARVYTQNLIWKPFSGGFAALVQNLMVTNTAGVQSFNDNSTNGAPYRDPNYQYASSGTGGTFYFTVNLSDGQAVVPRSFSITVSPNAAPQTLQFASNGSWTAPNGVNKVMFNWVIGGGGGGGASTEGGNGGGGGGGGSGGWYRYTEVNCSPGDLFEFFIGAGGTGGAEAVSGPAASGTDGGYTIVRQNGSDIIAVTGGGGGAGNPNAIAPGGHAGSPNGTEGTYGQRGAKDNSSMPGGAGAAGPKLGSAGGAGGPAAAYTGSNGGDGQGYGSGGGGGGSHDRKVPRNRPGGNGVGGYVEFTFPSQGPTGGTP